MVHHLSQPNDKSEGSLHQKVDEIVSQDLALSTIDVVRVRRCFGDPGPVKVEFISDTAKVDVMKAKSTLKDKPQYNNLYIRSAKLNFKTVADHLQVSDVFKFTCRGRLVP